MAGADLASALGRDGQDQILGFRHLVIAFLAERDIGDGLVFLRFGPVVGCASQRAAHFQIGGAFFAAGHEMADHRHRHHHIALAKPDATHARGIASLEDTHIGSAEPYGAPARGDQHHIVIFRADARVHHLHVRRQFHRDLAVGFDIGEV